ncbi:uncharacterized protein LOC113305701 [Papaver somniferum]|uniref:uncharacterized protein LOC113305701 n=1 Tax=Papaver somniferum TaxID=3469 RepID=UPI000E6F6851|nr:uncharacterized protein LOC113305701 [Papaver somniferum]
MKIMSWNVQGFGNKRTRYHLRDLVRSNDPDIIFLAETKNKDNKMMNYTKQLNYPYYCYVHPIDLSGRLFLLWKDGIILDIVEYNLNFIICSMQFDNRSGKTLLVCMYGAFDEEGIARQSDFLTRLSGRFNCPWVVTGDLNFITSNEEKLGGNIVPQNQLNVVNDHLDFLDLTNIRFMGNLYTRSNRRDSAGLILERLDIGLGNHKWFNLFPNRIVYHLLPIGSDHCPILLVSTKDDKPTKKLLRFNRCWLMHNSCKDIIRDNWKTSERGSHAYFHSMSLRNVKYVLRDWNIIIFGNIQSKITYFQSQLEYLSGNVANHVNLNEIRDTEASLNHWYGIQQDHYMQRAKENVLKFDDRNTKYFHDKVNFRKKRT